MGWPVESPDMERFVNRKNLEITAGVLTCDIEAGLTIRDFLHRRVLWSEPVLCIGTIARGSTFLVGTGQAGIPLPETRDLG